MIDSEIIKGLFFLSAEFDVHGQLLIPPILCIQEINTETPCLTHWTQTDDFCSVLAQCELFLCVPFLGLFERPRLNQVFGGARSAQNA